jgi:hypothetical protein
MFNVADTAMSVRTHKRVAVETCDDFVAPIGRLKDEVWGRCSIRPLIHLFATSYPSKQRATRVRIPRL